MKKQADVVMLTTEKATSHIAMRNGKQQGTGLTSAKEGYLEFCGVLERVSVYNDCWDSVHLYFVSDEKIKTGEVNFWFLDLGRESYSKAPYFCDCGVTDNFILTKEINFPFPDKCKKIVATTDPRLWKDGVGKIGFDFVHLFIKKSNEDTPIKQVMLEYEATDIHKYTGEETDNIAPKTRSNGSVIVSPVNAKEYTEEELFLNMQYYHEYCQMKGYVTPQAWLNKHKHF